MLPVVPIQPSLFPAMSMLLRYSHERQLAEFVLSTRSYMTVLRDLIAPLYSTDERQNHCEVVDSIDCLHQDLPSFTPPVNFALRALRDGLPLQISCVSVTTCAG